MKEFKVKPNLAVGIWLGALTLVWVYDIVMFVLMSCEVICDPVSRMADLVTRPHAIELYTDLKKRYSTFPKDRYEFVDAICESNKRIHCTVADYTDQHRKIEKKERRENRRRRKINKRS